jgi:hypothetical protein
VCEFTLITGSRDCWFTPAALALHMPMSLYTLYKSRMSFVGLSTYKLNTTFNNGSLGSRIDEERSEMR